MSLRTQGPRDPVDEVQAELDHYLELRTRELEAEGRSPEEARREATRRFGDTARVREACTAIQRRRRRRERRRSTVAGWGKDVRHAVRGLARTPAVTLAALATLALGIGANTAVFSVVRGVLLRPLPFPDPEELVTLHETRPRGLTTASPANYLDWRRTVTGFEALAAMTPQSASLLDGGAPLRTAVSVVSGNFFEVLGVSPAVGATFDPTLRIDPGQRRVVLGDALWVTRFGADPGVIGRTIRLDDDAYEVVGVMPPGFDFPEDTDLWMRAPEEAPGIPGFSGDITEVRTAWYLDVVGRLRDGVSIEAAQAELDAVAAALREAHPSDNEGAGITGSALHADLVDAARPLLLLLLGAVGLVLLATCANVANLFLVRAEGRRRDFAVRAALGAGETRLLRFVFTEGLLLAIAGGVLGVSIAAAGLPALQATLPATLPRRDEVGLDGTVLAFTLLVSLAACVLFATAPAVMARRSRPARALAGRGGGGGGKAGARLRGALVVTEVALGVVLATGTGLVVRSLARMASVEPGFRTEGLATVRISFPEAQRMSDEGRRERWRALLEGVTSVPGVERAGFGIVPPTARGPQAGLNVVRGDQGEIDADVSVVWHPATPGYLEALRVPLLRGRMFEEGDRAGSVEVALVSESLAIRFFPNEPAIGQRVTIGLDEGHEKVIEVVGVVGDTRNRGPAQPPTPVLYRPLAQAGGFGGGTMLLALRGPVDPAALATSVSSAVNTLDPTAVVYGGRLGSELGATFYAGHRFVSSLLGLFAALAVGLAAVGIYGVTAHAVGRRRRELGIRMAIGASRPAVWTSVMAGGLKLVLPGIAVGVAAVAIGGDALSAFLFGIDPLDPVTLAGVVSALLAVGLLALAVPARQAVRVDPAESIRAE